MTCITGSLTLQEGLVMETISVHELVCDRALNPRLHGVDQEVVEYYAAIYREVNWPPVLVDRATRKLLDGWHRVEAAKRAGSYSVPVQWVEIKEDELFATAVKANLVHGVHLTREERYRAIARLQREGWTNQRIAESLGCALAMIDKTEKAEDLRTRFKVTDHPGAKLPTETLVEVTRLPQEFHEELVELVCEVEAEPRDVRRTVRAIKKGVIDTAQEIRQAMMNPEYLKAREAGVPSLASGDWLMTFATLADQLESTDLQVTPVEREAAASLFRRVRLWADRQLSRLGLEETPAML